MRKIAVASILCIMIVSAFIVGCTSINESADVPKVHVPDHMAVDQENYNNSYGLSKAEKADAINIVLNEPMVREILPHEAYSGPADTINKVALYEDNDFQGYLNSSVRMAVVNISLTHRNWGVSAMVDLDNKKCMVLITTILRRNDPMYGYVVLPPGSAWYRMLLWTFNYNISFTMEPPEVTLYPLVADGTNFMKYKSGEPYQAYEYWNPIVNKTYSYDGTTPITNNSRVYVDTNIRSIAEDTVHHGAFFVLKNNGPEEVKVNLNF